MHEAWPQVTTHGKSPRNRGYYEKSRESRELLQEQVRMGSNKNKKDHRMTIGM